jgi:hypothetical protein
MGERRIELPPTDGPTAMAHVRQAWADAACLADAVDALDRQVDDGVRTAYSLGLASLDAIITALGARGTEGVGLREAARISREVAGLTDSMAERLAVES